MKTFPESKLVKHQKKVFTLDSNAIGKAAVTVDGIDYRKVVAEVRFDDCCGNGYNSFSITGDAWETGSRRRDPDTCGCIHEIIERAFPELAPLIRFHLCSTDGPLHYVANALYHARTCTHEGKKPGDPVKFSTRLKFEGFPLAFAEQTKGFWAWMEKQDSCFSGVEVVEVQKKQDPHIYSPNYTLTGFIGDRINSEDWYNCPFKDYRAASEFLECLKSHKYEFIKTPIAWAQAVTPNLEAARRSADWPDATLEQLQDKTLLENRLPGLLDELKTAVESLGMEY